MALTTAVVALGLATVGAVASLVGGLAASEAGAAAGLLSLEIHLDVW
jgi:hypothetical protein